MTSVCASLAEGCWEALAKSRRWRDRQRIPLALPERLDLLGFEAIGVQALPAPLIDKREARTATAIDQAIGARIRARRLELRLSQERLGELIGVSFQQVQKYEKGTNRVSAAAIVEIANVLDMPAAALLPLCRADAAAEIVERRQSPFLADLAPFESLLNDEGRALLLALAQTLAQQPRLRSG